MQRRHRILVVDDEEGIRSAVAEALADVGPYDCLQASDGDEALDLLRRETVNLVLTDMAMPRLGGAPLIEALHRFNPEIPVIVMTGHGSIDSAVELLRLGAHDYVTKPFKMRELSGRIARALERLDLIEEVRALRLEIEPRRASVRYVGNAPATLRMLRQLPSIARSEAAVILCGESGTGKEVVARTIHDLSARARAAFVTVNCGALPEALLENELFGHARGAYTDAREHYAGLAKAADGGTLLLDEVAEMSPATQVKLLRFLQEREYRPLGSTRTQRVDVRVIAATNKDLRRRIADGSFREDLFYRLNIIPITLPPLRDRKEDIPLLVRHFLDRMHQAGSTAVESLSPLAVQKLMGHDWPGNVRELENKVLQVIALASTTIILPEHIDLPLRHDAPTRPDGRLKSFKDAKRDVVDAFEIGYVTQVLGLARGNISEAARLARKHRRAFWEIMKKHDLAGRERELLGEAVVEPDLVGSFG